MTRTQFLASICAIPFIGKLFKEKQFYATRTFTLTQVPLKEAEPVAYLLQYQNVEGSSGLGYPSCTPIYENKLTIGSERIITVDQIKPGEQIYLETHGFSGFIFRPG